MPNHDQPMASRPRIEGYGVPETIEGALPWGHAAQRLEAARNYWIVTCDARGRPHAVPVWAVWLEGALFFSTAPTTRTARNLAVNPQASVHLESGDDVVILEGTAQFVQPLPPAISAAIDDAMAAKYGYRPSSDGSGPTQGMFVLSPRVAFAWTAFPSDATRWTFSADRFVPQ
ncbi:MAG: pyridoxamine 5'-phosphate oxidase [Chloroflexota bacterium]